MTNLSRKTGESHVTREATQMCLPSLFVCSSRCMRNIYSCVSVTKLNTEKSPVDAKAINIRKRYLESSED
jgi:hypothetical protein